MPAKRMPARCDLVYDARPPAVALPGETVAWTGAPPLGLRLRRSDALLIPFSFLWGGFAIFWESIVVNSSAPWFFKLWGIPFVLVGLYLMFGRFFVDAALRARTNYTVTDRAAYIARVGLLPAIRRYAGSALDTIQYESEPDGTGTIRFAFQTPYLRMFGGAGRWSFWNDASFDAFVGVKDARGVYALVIDARDK